MLVPEQNPAAHPVDPALQPGSTNGIPWGQASTFAHQQAMRMLGPRKLQLAEDVAQEALRRLVVNHARIKIGWKPYLAKIVANVGWTRLHKEKIQRARVASDMVAMEEATCTDFKPPDQVVADELDEALSLLLDKLDDEFGRGTKAIVDLRSRDVPWQEITKIVKLKERACAYRHTKATTWLCERLSLQDRNRRNGGPHD